MNSIPLLRIFLIYISIWFFASHFKMHFFAWSPYRNPRFLRFGRSNLRTFRPKIASTLFSFGNIVFIKDCFHHYSVIHCADNFIHIEFFGVFDLGLCRARALLAFWHFRNPTFARNRSGASEFLVRRGHLSQIIWKSIGQINIGAIFVAKAGSVDRAAVYIKDLTFCKIPWIITEVTWRPAWGAHALLWLQLIKWI